MEPRVSTRLRSIDFMLLCFLWFGSSKSVLLTERGVFIEFLMEWGRFDHYNWDPKDGEVLRIVPKQKPDGWWWRVGYRVVPLEFKVPRDKREAVTGLLEQYFPRTNKGEAIDASIEE